MFDFHPIFAGLPCLAEAMIFRGLFYHFLDSRGELSDACLLRSGVPV